MIYIYIILYIYIYTYNVTCKRICQADSADGGMHLDVGSSQQNAS